jgi:hypothetical protein
MSESDGGPSGDGKTFRILSLDGGGIRGVFPAALLARLEEHLELPIGHYFDLIAGTSTGGIIAIGLGLGLSAREILNLYVEQGPAIFDQQHGAVQNWVRQKVRGMAHLFVTKHSSQPLRHSLEEVLGRRRLGESRTRLVIPAWHPVLERVYIYKTAHHPRLETDYKQLAIDAAMATAAAPTFLKPHMTESAVELIDGGVWANNPIGVAAIEAIGMLGWPGDKLKIRCQHPAVGQIGPPQVRILVRIAAQVVHHRQLRRDVTTLDGGTISRVAEDRFVDLPLDRQQLAVHAEEHVAIAPGRSALAQHESRGVDAVDRSILGYAIRCTRHPGQRRQPVHCSEYLFRDDTVRDLAGPADHRRHPHASFEWRVEEIASPRPI